MTMKCDDHDPSSRPRRSSDKSQTQGRGGDLDSVLAYALCAPPGSHHLYTCHAARVKRIQDVETRSSAARILARPCLGLELWRSRRTVRGKSPPVPVRSR